MKKRFIVALLSFLLLCAWAYPSSPVFTPSEAETMLGLIERCNRYSQDISETTKALDSPLANINGIMTDLKLTTESLGTLSQELKYDLEYTSTTLTSISNTYSDILTDSKENTEQQSSLVTNYENLTTDLEIVSKNLKPTFWESSLGRGLMYSAGTALMASTGALTGNFVAGPPGAIVGAAAGAVVGSVTITIILDIIDRKRESK
jgi:hypothetical protein